MNVTVFGIGYVGLVQAAVLAEAGGLPKKGLYIIQLEEICNQKV